MRETKHRGTGRATCWRRGAGTAGGRRLGTAVRKRGGREGGRGESRLTVEPSVVRGGWARCGRGVNGSDTTTPTRQRDAGRLTLLAVEGERRLPRDGRDAGRREGRREAGLPAGNSRRGSIRHELARASRAAVNAVLLALASSMYRCRRRRRRRCRRCRADVSANDDVGGAPGCIRGVRDVRWRLRAIHPSAPPTERFCNGGRRTRR